MSYFIDLRLNASNDPVLAGLEINALTLNEPVLILQTLDDDPANPILEIQDSGGVMLSEIQAVGNLNFTTGLAANPGMVEINDARFLHTYGTNNLFMGENAGNFALTGDANTGIGEQTLQSLTDGSFNVGIGYRAGEAITEGEGNVLVGRQTGLNITTGPRNVCLGNSAGLNITTGGDNFCLGTGAGLNITTSSWNTFIGTSAGLNLTTGDSNVGLGESALRTATTARGNIAIGVNAGFGILDTNWNVAIGFRAMQGAAGAEDCIAIGMFAGQDFQAQGNVAIGRDAGFTTTGEFNVFLGYNAGRLQDASNELYISNSDTATPLIYGEFDGVGDGVGIKIHSPATGAITLVVKGMAGQTASLLELHESDGSVMLASGDGLGGSVFSGNVQLEDIDFVWAGNTEANLFRIDAGADEVRMGDWDTNYVKVDKAGEMSFEGTATVWNDIFFPMSSGRIGGANQPSWAAFQGNTFEYTFAINDYIHLPSGEILHSYKEGSDIELHIHIVLDGSDAGDTDVNYEIEYTIGDINEVMSAAAIVTSGDYTITGGTADRMHIRIDIGTVAGINLLSMSALKMRFRRIALVGGGNAPSNDPFVLMVGAHIEEDTVGSRTEDAK